MPRTALASSRLPLPLCSIREVSTEEVNLLSEFPLLVLLHLPGFARLVFGGVGCQRRRRQVVDNEPPSQVVETVNLFVLAVEVLLTEMGGGPLFD